MEWYSWSQTAPKPPAQKSVLTSHLANTLSLLFMLPGWILQAEYTQAASWRFYFHLPCCLKITDVNRCLWWLRVKGWAEFGRYYQSMGRNRLTESSVEVKGSNQRVWGCVCTYKICGSVWRVRGVIRKEKRGETGMWERKRWKKGRDRKLTGHVAFIDQGA